MKVFKQLCSTEKYCFYLSVKDELRFSKTQAVLMRLSFYVGCLLIPLFLNNHLNLEAAHSP